MRDGFFWFMVMFFCIGQSVIHFMVVMSKEGNMSNSFRFIVVLMVSSMIISPGGGFGFSEFGGNFSEFIVHNLGFLQSINVEVSNWVDGLFLCSSSCVFPFGLNLGKMPLINYYNLHFCLISVNVVEDVCAFLVHNHFFLIRGVGLKELREPVNLIRIDSFRKLFSSESTQHSVVGIEFVFPDFVLKSPPVTNGRSNGLESGFDFKGFNGFGV